MPKQDLDMGRMSGLTPAKGSAAPAERPQVEVLPARSKIEPNPPEPRKALTVMLPFSQYRRMKLYAVERGMTVQAVMTKGLARLMDSAD